MSYGARYHVQHKVLLEGTELTFLAEVMENGYGGGSTKLEGHEDAGVFALEYEGLSPEEIRKRPILKSRLELYFVVQGSSELGILDTIFGSDDSKYRLRLSLDGSKIWEGPVVTDLVERPTGRYDPGTITAKDFTRLPSQDYSLATGRDTIASVFADVLSGEGLGFDLKTIPSFSNKNTSDSDDWMNQISLNKKRIRKFAQSSDESDQPHDKWTVLQTMARNFQTLIFQSEGVWYLIQLTGDANDPATVYTYNSSGVKQSSSSVDLDALVDKSSRWLLDSSQYIGTPGVSKVTVDFNHQSTEQFQTIPEVIAITDVDVTNVQTPVPFFQSDGSQKIKFNCGVEADSTGDETKMTARIEFRVGESGNYYYLDNSGSSLSWNSSQVDYEIELDDFSGDPGGPNPGINDEITGDSSGRWMKRGGERGIAFTTPNIPADADGSIQITFKGAVDQVPNVVPETRYYGIGFTLTEEDAESDSRSVTYEITQDGDYSGVYELGETWFGDGPAAYSVSSLTWNDGGNQKPTNNDWRRVGGSAELKFHDVVGREIIDTQRKSTEVIRAQLLGSYKPHQVLATDGGSNRYVFIGGRLTGADAIWEADFLNINVDTAGDRDIGVIVDDPDGSTGSGGGGGGGSEDPKAIAELTDDVSNTTATSLPVNVYAGKAIESGKDYYIWHRAKRKPTYFTALEDLDSGDATLDIEEQVVVAPDESKIYKDEGQKETERVIQVEQQTATASAQASFKASVKNEREATAIGTTSAELSGSGVTSIPLENIAQEVKLDNGDTLTLLDVSDGNEGENTDVTVNGDQTLSAGTGTLTINSKTFSHTFPSGSTLFEPARGLTARVTATARVTTQNTDNIATVQAQADSNSAQVVLKAESTSGNITKLALVQLDSSVAGGSAITMSADLIQINGVVFDDGAGLMRSTDFDASTQTGWRLTGGSSSKIEIGNAVIWGGSISGITLSGNVGAIRVEDSLPASGNYEGEPLYLTGEPNTLYRWDGSNWNSTVDGEDLLVNSVTAGKINVATLSAITADIGTANISDKITMGASGEVNISSGELVMDADGLSFTIGGSNAQMIKWYNGTTLYGRVNTSAAGELTLIGWDGSQTNIGITVGNGISMKLDTTFETGVTVTFNDPVVVPNATNATHALNENTADDIYVQWESVNPGTPSGSSDAAIRVTVDGNQYDLAAWTV